MNPYLRSVYQIFTAGRFTNSYKFALARSLVRLVRDLGKNDLFIGKRDLAPCFLEYYWPLETTYHLRQGVDPDKDPIVMVQIRRLVKQGIVDQGDSLIAFAKHSPDKYERLLHVIENEAFDDVIPRFHNVRGKNVSPMLFHFTGKVGDAGEGITLTSDSKAALIDNGQVIDYMAIAAWAEFTESFTTAPRLFEKLSGQVPARQPITKWRATLEEIQRGHCFHCENELSGRPEVDHALPWSFVLEDKTWNLVLACSPCNSSKRDHLVDTTTLHRLLARNDMIAKRELPVGDKFLRHFDEWQIRNLSGHIKALYDQAQQDGFPTWESVGTKQ